MKLTAHTVNETFLDCLYGEDLPEDPEEYPDDALIVEGIMITVAFRKDTLTGHRATIDALLDELPDPFHEDRGGGWSFLNACNDRHNRQWADLHRTMEELVLLGLGTGRVRFGLPRDIWPALPGGMPYFTIDRKPDG